MTIGEIILELQKHPPEGIVELCGCGGSMGSEDTGWMPTNEECESVRETKSGVILSPY
jgi:hypothetical protein